MEMKTAEEIEYNAIKDLRGKLISDETKSITPYQKTNTKAFSYKIGYMDSIVAIDNYLLEKFGKI